MSQEKRSQQQQVTCSGGEAQANAHADLRRSEALAEERAAQRGQARAVGFGVQVRQQQKLRGRVRGCQKPCCSALFEGGWVRMCACVRMFVGGWGGRGGSPAR